MPPVDDSRWKAGWRCLECGQEVPEWFEVCWNCARDKPTLENATCYSGAPPTVEIDGLLFNTLDEFFTHFAERSGLPSCCGSLDVFNDILREESGFGVPSGGFVIRWRNHKVSMERLGKRFPSAEKQSKWLTIFDTIVVIIREHGPGGVEARDNVQLELL